MDQDPELLDIQQAATLLNVTETTLRRWTNSGRLACLRIGAKRERRFRRSDLLALLEAQPALEAPPRGRRVLARTDGIRASDQPTPAEGNVPNTSTLVAGVAIHHGTHLCSFHTSVAGRARAAVGFLADGLSDGGGFCLAGSPPFTREVLARLEADHPGLRKDLGTGRYAAGDFCGSPGEQLAWLEARVVAFLRQGVRSVRIVACMTNGSFERRSSFAQLMEFDESYDRLIARRFPIVTLCQYDARRYSGAQLCEVLKRHPDVFSYPHDRLLC